MSFTVRTHREPLAPSTPFPKCKDLDDVILQAAEALDAESWPYNFKELEDFVQQVCNTHRRMILRKPTTIVEAFKARRTHYKSRARTSVVHIY